MFMLWSAAAMRWPCLWLFVLPACLPAMNFAPWTGWIVFDEFDFVALGALASGFACFALRGREAEPPAATSVGMMLPRTLTTLTLLCGVPGGLALAHGLVAVGAWHTGWYDGHADALNALRVFKGLLYALLLVPLLQEELRRSRADVVSRVSAGMLAGIGVVAVAALWERAAYPGLFDFSDSYRTVALFWEMHVGGAAIDTYLAIAVPFVAQAVASAKGAVRWTAAAVLAVLVEYTCLTTFSRGVYLAVAAGLVVLVLLRRSDANAQPRPRRRRANLALVALLLVEALAIVGSDSFMVARVKRSPDDFSSRLAHWHNGLTLLHGPAQWWFGKGLGRLPSEYAASVPEHEFSGRAQPVTTATGGRHVRLSGPARSQELGGLYALTQRVTLAGADGHRVDLDARMDTATRLGLSVCELHLLYEGACQRGVVRMSRNGAGWQHLSLDLQGPRLDAGVWPPRVAVFAISVIDAGATVEIDNVELHGGTSANLLRNGDFSRELARWFPVAHHYFVPWHIDNLYLELLIEQGIVGLAGVALLFGCAFARLLSPRTRGLPLSPVLVASLASTALIGVVSSVLDVPRVAFLLFFLLFLSIQLGEAPAASESR